MTGNAPQNIEQIDSSLREAADPLCLSSLAYVSSCL